MTRRLTQNEEHARLHLPYDPPLPATLGGTLPAIPSLWERAKNMFARVIGHIGSTSAFSKRWVVRRKERRELLQWLVPVEKLVRACLITRALTWLLITAEGRRLARETPRMAMPEPPKPAGAGPKLIHRIPYPGWHTIWANQRALAEARKLEQQRAAEAAARDAHDPENWGCGFRVLGWKLPEPDDECAPAQKKRSPLFEVFDPEIHVPRERKDKREPDPPGLILARRIESLGRVLANPAPAIARLARFIARLPEGAFDNMRVQPSHPRHEWFHGHREFREAGMHVRRALAHFCEIRPG